MNKIPLVIVTGFLGSGKTSVLSNFLAHLSNTQKIAVVENEFAPSSIDGDILRNLKDNFVLKEINKGSIFCACKFSNFLDILKDLADSDFDAVFVEPSGISDPIAISQVLDDKIINSRYYLQKIISVLDASRYLKGIYLLPEVKHQIEVADYVIINKIDLVTESDVNEISSRVFAINPFAKIQKCEYGNFTINDLMDNNITGVYKRDIRGQLTKCKDNPFISNVVKISKPINIQKLITFLNGLDSDILRIKGYVSDEKGQSYIVQYLPGQIDIVPIYRETHISELICIGYKSIDFDLL